MQINEDIRDRVHRVLKVTHNCFKINRNKSTSSLKDFKKLEKIGVSREQIIQEFLPPDYAKRKYLKTYESGWTKMHELLIKQPEGQFKQNLDHIKNYTEFQMAIVPAEMDHLLDMRLQKQMASEYGRAEDQAKALKLRQKLLNQYSMQAGVGVD